MLSNLVIFLVTGFCLAWAQATDWRVIGGAQVKLGQYPMMAQIMDYPSGKHSCGATILTHNIVMTAAHCFRCNDMAWCAKTHKVLVGDINRQETRSAPTSRQILGVKRLVPHENYRFNSFEYDILLIELDDSIKFSTNAHAGNLSIAKPRANETCTVAGWGNIKPGRQSFSPELQAVNLTTVDPSLCKAKLQRFMEDGMICAGDVSGKNDSCQGDSGGPLLCGNQTVAGIVSYGVGCARPGFAAAYTDVAHYRSWINETVERIKNGADQWNTGFKSIFILRMLSIALILLSPMGNFIQIW